MDDDDVDEVPEDFDQFDATLPLNDPIKQYRQLIEERMKVKAFVPTEMGFGIWDKISAGAREAIWKLLFDEENPTQENVQIATDFLKEHREDACYYSPWYYNEWVVELRDELLKRKMLDFWKNVVVAEELGPAWARDSDLYDDMDDPEPAQFYAYAGCEAPWLKEKEDNSKQTTSTSKPLATEESTSSLLSNSFKKLSLESSLHDYKYNMEIQSKIDDADNEAYENIFSQARELIWQLLFSDVDLKDDSKHEAAATLLQEYRRDAKLYAPHEFNEWIVKLRDELFNRKYFGFWQQVIVEKKLGPCWSKNSDQDKEEPKPLQFYESGMDITKDNLLSSDSSKKESDF